ncbi:MAG: DUF11 domain-containing protein, partial [Planctomycetes bacterium]|nr:DUF11 domain-containing protein [Planctomycetota bacterium]
DVATAPDISVSKTPAIYPYHQNENVTWDITVVNNGESAASRIVIIDEIPTEMDTVSFSYTNPGGAMAAVSPDSVNGDSMYFAINEPVDPGDSVTVSITALIPDGDCVANPDSNRVWVYTGCPDMSDSLLLLCATDTAYAVSRANTEVRNLEFTYTGFITEPWANRPARCDKRFFSFNVVNRDSINAYPNFVMTAILSRSTLK